MSPEQVIQWFTNLSLIFQLTLVGLVMVAVQQVRQKHIGRVGTVGIGIIVIQQAYPTWETLPQIWQIYVAGAGVCGLIAGVSYLTKASLPSEFYKFVFYVYGAFTVGIILIFGFP
ncbi:hypothetical protein ACERIT_13385 [Halopenitus sp. H-Gu1]|uniref:hypothetical protein n=1 Tax=Halopenitus sp. H-Gu1 TaxID=3242697 RepID=UPI00359E3E59